MARKLLLGAACALMLIGTSSAVPTYEGALPPVIAPAIQQVDSLDRPLFVKTNVALDRFDEGAVRVRVAEIRRECDDTIRWYAMSRFWFGADEDSKLGVKASWCASFSTWIDTNGRIVPD